MMRFFIVNDNFATEPIIMILQMLNNKIMIKIDT